MDNITSQPAHLRLAIATGVSSSQLAALLALQRAEEPEVCIAFFEVAGDELLDGLRELWSKVVYGAGAAAPVDWVASLLVLK